MKRIITKFNRLGWHYSPWTWKYVNDTGALKLPDHSFLTQILKTNAKGEFTFVPPRAGWWALTAIPQTKASTRNPEGKKVKAELGGVLWIRCVDMK